MIRGMLIFLVMLLLNCGKSNHFVYEVPWEFDLHVKKFEAEARARGKDITIKNLIIKYDDAASTIFCANSNVVSATNDVQKIILVNPQVCWQNDTQLETLIFHELGHCILGRQHDTSRMPKGDAKTIMFPDDITLYSPCVYNLGNPCDLIYRRPYYVDELFYASTPVPDWAK
jgi:hypothetical protein